VHPGPSRLEMFKALVAELFDDATSPAHLTERLVARHTTPWSTMVIDTLRRHAGPVQEVRSQGGMKRAVPVANTPSLVAHRVTLHSLRGGTRRATTSGPWLRCCRSCLRHLPTAASRHRNGTTRQRHRSRAWWSLLTRPRAPWPWMHGCRRCSTSLPFDCDDDGTNSKCTKVACKRIVRVPRLPVCIRIVLPRCEGHAVARQ